MLTEESIENAHVMSASSTIPFLQETIQAVSDRVSDPAHHMAIFVGEDDTGPRTYLRTGKEYATSPETRILDVVLSFCLILVFLPLLLVIAFMVAVTSRGGPLFLQRRNGMEGRSFRIMKFRTMFSQPENAGFLQAVPGDPRVTRLGFHLRRLSADELPQLWNVLRGEMSLVGPRPHAVEHDAMFLDRIPGYGDRFAARPGITGLAQVRGCRGGTATDDIMKCRIDADLEYLATASILTDIRILLATFGQVVFCRHVY